MRTLTEDEKWQNDRALMVWFAKGLLTYGQVVEKADVLKQKPKHEVNRLMNAVRLFNKYLDQSLTDSERLEADDFSDDLFKFVEQFMASSGHDRQVAIDAVNNAEYGEPETDTTPKVPFPADYVQITKIGVKTEV